MTEVSLDIYRGKTVEWFTGNPMITQNDEPVSMATIRLPGIKPEPFLTDFTVKIREGVGAVYDKGVWVAGHYWSPKSTLLYTAESVRGKGIATQLVLLGALRYPGRRFAIARSQGGQAIYLRVWDLIQPYLAEGK